MVRRCNRCLIIIRLRGKRRISSLHRIYGCSLEIYSKTQTTSSTKITPRKMDFSRRPTVIRISSRRKRHFNSRIVKILISRKTTGNRDNLRSSWRIIYPTATFKSWQRRKTKIGRNKNRRRRRKRRLTNKELRSR